LVTGDLGQASVGDLLWSLKIVVRNFVPREVIFPEDVSWMMAKKREGMPRGVSRGVLGYRHMDAKEGAFRN
jgi:hypothetical protein